MLSSFLIGTFPYCSTASVPFPEHLWTWWWENFIPYFVVSSVFGFSRVSVLRWLFKKLKPHPFPVVDDVGLRCPLVPGVSLCSNDFNSFSQISSFPIVLVGHEGAESPLNTIKFPPCVGRCLEVNSFLNDFILFVRPLACSHLFLPSGRSDGCCPHSCDLSPASKQCAINLFVLGAFFKRIVFDSSSLSFLFWFYRRFCWIGSFCRFSHLEGV
jgi:hypothetical protein